MPKWWRLPATKQWLQMPLLPEQPKRPAVRRRDLRRRALRLRRPPLREWRNMLAPAGPGPAHILVWLPGGLLRDPLPDPYRLLLPGEWRLPASRDPGPRGPTAAGLQLQDTGARRHPPAAQSGPPAAHSGAAQWPAAHQRPQRSRVKHHAGPGAPGERFRWRVARGGGLSERRGQLDPTALCRGLL